MLCQQAAHMEHLGAVKQHKNRLFGPWPGLQTIESAPVACPITGPEKIESRRVQEAGSIFLKSGMDEGAQQGYVFRANPGHVTFTDKRLE